MWKHLLKLYDESRLNDGPPECLFAETLIFNEGWLLRSVLDDGVKVNLLPLQEARLLRYRKVV
jgi:hypothetical protein